MRRADALRRAAALAGLAVFIAAGCGISSGFTFRKAKKAEEPRQEEKATPQQEAAAEPEQAAPEAGALASRVAELERENEQLKQDYKHLEEDRDNVLAQTRLLLADKSKFSESQALAERLKASAARTMAQKRKLQRLVRDARRQAASAAGQAQGIRRSTVELERRAYTLEQENEQLSLALAEKIDRDPQFRKLTEEIRGLKRDNQELRESMRRRERDEEKAFQALKKMQQTEEKQRAQIADQKERLRLADEERNKIIAENRLLRQKLEGAPGKFQEMARENEMLIKETSDMHYNLGVFFVDNGHFKRALKEFERALDFNPNNAKVHYNLGYLYSQEFKKHDEALNHFKRYLEIEPGSKESEEIRAYMLTREPYGDKPVKDTFSTKNANL